MRIVVVGGGISGLVVAHGLLRAGVDVRCLEPGERPGGWLRTERRDGFLCETGPQSILDGVPETRALIETLGLEPEIVRASPQARRRFVYIDGRLRVVPNDPFSLVTSDLLSASGKWRIMREPFVKARAADGEEETILGFGERRLGAEAARKLVAPATIGVFAGDAGRLAVRSAFPRLAALEDRHGSLTKGLRAMRKEGAGPGKAFSFRDGLERLPRALAAALGERMVRAAARALRRDGAGWVVEAQTPDGAASLAADAVVLATPGRTTASLLAPLDGAGADALRGLPVASVAVLAFGWRQAEGLGIDADAYGFLVARGEGVGLLGCQYESSVFPGRAPEGGLLLRVIRGGVFEPEAVEEDEQVLVDRTLAELRAVLGTDRLGVRRPDLVGVWRCREAIPQYERGHEARVRAVEATAATLPGLHVTGASLRGVGINDCIRNATALAARLAAAP